MRIKYKLSLIALCATSLFIPIINSFTNISNATKTIKCNANNDTSINNTNFITEQYETNDNLVFNGIDTKSVSLLKANQANKKFPIVSETIGSTTRNFIEFDIKKWKPNGMETEEFLKNLHINFDGLHWTKSIDAPIDSDNDGFNADYNINPKDEFNQSLDTHIFDQNNNDNLNVKKENNENAEMKLFYKFITAGNIKYQNTQTGYAYIVLELYHKVVRDKSNTNKILDDKLYVNPVVEFAKGNACDLPFSIPPQTFTISFSSPFFQFNQELNTMGDSYISDTKDFVLYTNESDSSSGGSSSSQKMTDYLTLTTNYGHADIHGIARVKLSPTTNKGKRIQPLKVDTSDFYLDDDVNHIDDTFNINIKGISIKDVKLNKQINSEKPELIAEWNNPNNKLPINTDFNFNISEAEFSKENNTIEKTIPIATQQIFNEFQDDSININNPESFKYSGLWIKFTIERLAPFKYQISAIEFISKSYSCMKSDVDTSITQYQTYSWDTLINTCRNIVVKVKPNNYDFNEIYQKLFYSQGNIASISSSYSSNIFDDSFIIDPATNKRIQSNYQKVYQYSLNNFINEMFKDNNFLTMADIKDAASLTDEQKLNVLNNVLEKPFIQTQYTTNEIEFRRIGYMSLKFSPVKKIKFFQTLDFIQRVKIEDNPNQKELVKIELDKEKLNQEAKSFSSIASYAEHLDNLPLEEKYEYLQVINNDTNQSLPFIIASVKFSYVPNSSTMLVDVTTKDTYTILQNEILTHNVQFEASPPFETVNVNQQELVVNQDLMIKNAKEATDYNDFILKNKDKVFKHIKLQKNERR